MKQKCNHTLEEIEENEFVNQQYQNRMHLIYEFCAVCNLKIEDLCIHLNIDTSTYYRYQNDTAHISINHYICACMYFQQYMKDNRPRYTPKLLDLIKQTEIFPIDSITAE